MNADQLRQEFQQIVSELGGKLYDDPYFPPTEDSLIKPENKKKTPWFADGVCWRRIPDIEILGPDSVIFDGKIQPNDINQACQGNSYFLACLAAIAEFPERIKRIMAHEVRNPSEIYGVIMFIHGMRQLIVIDNQLPVRIKKHNG